MRLVQGCHFYFKMLVLGHDHSSGRKFQPPPPKPLVTVLFMGAFLTTDILTTLLEIKDESTWEGEARLL